MGTIGQIKLLAKKYLNVISIFLYSKDIQGVKISRFTNLLEFRQITGQNPIFFDELTLYSCKHNNSVDFRQNYLDQ